MTTKLHLMQSSVTWSMQQ